MLVISMLYKYKLLEIVYIPKVELILKVFIVLKLYIGQDSKYTSYISS